MGDDGADYSNIAAGGQVNVTHIMHAIQHEDGGSDEINVEGLSGELVDNQPALAHDLGGAKHNADTLADLNLKVSDATLDDEDDPRTPKAHKTSHQNGGSDEISVAGLSGDLADKQDADKLQGRIVATTAPSTTQVLAWNATLSQWEPADAGASAAHASQHENGGADEISVEGLSGDLADTQDAKAHLLGSATHTADTLANLNAKVSDATLDDSGDARTPSAHKTSHQNGGSDEISVAGLSGELADNQPPKAHASSHNDGGSDELEADELAGANGTDGQVLKSDGAAAAWEDDIASITFIIDGAGSAIATGEKGHLEIPFACTIKRVTMLADQSGSIVVDIWKDTYANFPPTDADSITASAPPTISAAQKSQDATLTGWTTAITAGDILAYNVDSCTTITRVTISLTVEKT